MKSQFVTHSSQESGVHQAMQGHMGEHQSQEEEEGEGGKHGHERSFKRHEDNLNLVKLRSQMKFRL